MLKLASPSQCNMCVCVILFIVRFL
uniref:Uncharacterized protein n=1 Tax=Anguilla anguilla TaxID=7936 RepID=A0A0E9PQQ8_ANGAN